MRLMLRDTLADLPLIGEWFESRPTLPELIRNHEEARALDQVHPLEEYVFSVVDTELTGLDPRQDEIVSIGAVRVRNMRIDPSDGFNVIVRPGVSLPKLTTLIHRIGPEAVENAPRLEAVLPGFIDWLGGSLIVGHHVGLDMSFLNRACRTHFGAGLKSPCLDTMRMAQAFQEEKWSFRDDAFSLKISYNLGNLSELYGLPRLPEHDALADALQAAYLFLFLARKLRKGNVRTLKDLHQAAKPRRFI